ncbi:MAG: hypothetical protein COT92_00525 [Candidatus Doudnabacteria bacterium CG10_big_fil_rev_8_21_14_0_10_42_18]|uniref:Uncharacterized protein n=1 Tax=Candidatus Doudnabacteria bacterium CG10_big_fil_rev_8_21_14_0_10_42_18 TaxID=1974552 RepID=A0A2H0VBS5_9BACT|nr:MAG: hypothetical protein COT92_00525 [Candidatus Doudnabacteria bacterium CG10_big_fil_rev_8_21_14_0_10_42_18]
MSSKILIDTFIELTGMLYTLSNIWINNLTISGFELIKLNCLFAPSAQYKAAPIIFSSLSLTEPTNPAAVPSAVFQVFSDIILLAFLLANQRPLNSGNILIPLQYLRTVDLEITKIRLISGTLYPFCLKSSISFSFS